MIAIDYGANNYCKNTLQALKCHKFTNPLEDVGDCDITVRRTMAERDLMPVVE